MANRASGAGDRWPRVPVPHRSPPGRVTFTPGWSRGAEHSAGAGRAVPAPGPPMTLGSCSPFSWGLGPGGAGGTWGGGDPQILPPRIPHQKRACAMRSCRTCPDAAPRGEVAVWGVPTSPRCAAPLRVPVPWAGAASSCLAPCEAAHPVQIPGAWVNICLWSCWASLSPRKREHGRDFSGGGLGVPVVGHSGEPTVGVLGGLGVALTPPLLSHPR